MTAAPIVTAIESPRFGDPIGAPPYVRFPVRLAEDLFTLRPACTPLTGTERMRNRPPA